MTNKDHSPQSRLARLAEGHIPSRPRQLEGKLFRIIAAPNPNGNRAERRAHKKKKK